LAGAVAIGYAIFTSGAPPHRYLGPLGASLLLSAAALPEADSAQAQRDNLKKLGKGT
jgi:hypothetical protein